jgi:hypothetical protein
MSAVRSASKVSATHFLLRGPCWITGIRLVWCDSPGRAVALGGLLVGWVGWLGWGGVLAPVAGVPDGAGVLGGVDVVRPGPPSVGVPAAVPGVAGVSPQPASTTDATAASAAILIPQ